MTDPAWTSEADAKRLFGVLFALCFFSALLVALPSIAFTVSSYGYLDRKKSAQPLHTRRQHAEATGPMPMQPFSRRPLGLPLPTTA